jgi:hypothetical protein
MANAFASNLGKDPGRYHVSQADADELRTCVDRYREALQASRSGERTATKTRIKDEARASAEAIIRRLAHVIRANPKIDAIVKMGVGLRERVAKAKQLPVPQEPPRLRFVQALHLGNGAVPMHELAFMSLDHKPKPPGAVRMELFVDLVPPEEPIPTHPGANLASRPWYLRSFTRSPIKLVPPMARLPMRVVYWGRWADSAGNVGPFSATTSAWIEGGMMRQFAPQFGGRKQIAEQQDQALPGPKQRSAEYSVAVLEAFYQSQHPTEVPQLPAADAKQLEGPEASEAA